MTPLVLIRHGPTDWSTEHRLQGRSDRPLSEEGRRVVAAWRVPKDFEGFLWQTSPLLRTRQTAALMNHPEAKIEPRTIEMNWGAWEGQKLPDLRRSLGEEMTRREALGLDLKAPGGESPREVQERLAPWLAELACNRLPTIAVTHKGVIRALYALAVGWDMRGDPAQKLKDGCAHRFTLDRDGHLILDRLNIKL